MLKTYLTQIGEYEGPKIEALDFGHAEIIAGKMGIKVIGEHKLTISCEGFTDLGADRICKALSESVEV